jgi:hypothetical protein
MAASEQLAKRKEKECEKPSRNRGGGGTFFPKAKITK